MILEQLLVTGTRVLLRSFFRSAVTGLFIAAIMSASEAVSSTPTELVSRLTEQDFTPGTFDTAFSTRELQAAQVIPVTIYYFMEEPPCGYLHVGFFNRSLSSLRRCLGLLPGNHRKWKFL